MTTRCKVEFLSQQSYHKIDTTKKKLPTRYACKIFENININNRFPFVKSSNSYKVPKNENKTSTIFFEKKPLFFTQYKQFSMIHM